VVKYLWRSRRWRTAREEARPERIAEAGMSLRLVRSPVAPKITITAGRRGGVHFQMIQAHEKGFLSSCVNGFLKALVPGLLFDVPAELEAHRR